jgi:murein L,D-transpeptidase YafK
MRSMTSLPGPFAALAVSLLLASMLSGGAARAEDRARDAERRRGREVDALLAAVGLPARPHQVYLRVFKEERVLELWASPRSGAPLVLVKSYPVCAASGELGPKRREGDLQVPEGLYRIVTFNPWSNYHLSMQVDYPNASDRLRSDRARPGGQIFIHGSCASIGCVAIEDGPIEEVYLVAQRSRTRTLRADLFPARLTPSWLESASPTGHLQLWQELLPAYEVFEATRQVPEFAVDPRTGAYRVGPKARQRGAQRAAAQAAASK